MAFFVENLPSGNAMRDYGVLEDLVYYLQGSKHNHEPPLLLEEIRAGIKSILEAGSMFTVIYNDTVIHSVEASSIPTHCAMLNQP